MKGVTAQLLGAHIRYGWVVHLRSAMAVPEHGVIWERTCTGHSCIAALRAAAAAAAAAVGRPVRRVVSEFQLLATQ